MSNQQQLQNQQPYNPHADPRSYGPYQPIQPPAEIWLRPGPTWDSYSTTAFPDQPDAVRYVRADLYDKRMAENVTEAPCRPEPLGTDYPR